MDVCHTFVLPIFLYGCEMCTWTEVQMGRLEVTHFNCIHRIVGMKVTDRHRLETQREQCGMSSLELIIRRRILQRMGHVLRMDEDCLPRQLCNPGCHEEGSGGGTTFRDFLELPGHTKLIFWPKIRAAMAERALSRQAWRDAF
eukprot:349707-Chlamydomonas_euryale.AAC.1